MIERNIRSKRCMQYDVDLRKDLLESAEALVVATEADLKDCKKSVKLHKKRLEQAQLALRKATDE